MRVIYKIARTELQMLFYSPIAWLLLLCFVIQTGSFFSGVYAGFVNNMEEWGRSYSSSRELFISLRGGPGLWTLVQGFLYYYIPLLTMGVVSKELSSGSIKLLYSSPISSTQIILGKFLAMVLYSLLFMAILFMYVVFAWCTVENFEAGWVLTGLLGVFLLMCTYMAVGIFVSSLTSYQIIAAVGTFVVLMLLSMVGGIGQHYDFVRDITYWLSIDGRAHTFVQGMLCSEDLIYFPVIIAMFLALTIIRLNAIRQKQAFSITFRKNMVVIGLVCIVAWVSSRPLLMVYYDATFNKQNTLTPNSQEIVNLLDGDMTITSYVNVLDRDYCMYTYPGFIIGNRNEFKKYTRFKPEIDLKVVYYYAEVEKYRAEGKYEEKSAWQQAKEMCEQNDWDSTWLKTPDEVDKMVDLSVEGHTFIRQIERENGQKEWLRAFNHGTKFPQEAEVTAAFKRMVMKLPRVGFVKGHNERDLHSEDMSGYSFIYDRKVQFALWNQGFDMEEITLDRQVPEEMDILIIADMWSELTPEEEASLRAYIDRGGNLFVLGEPRRREVVNPMLREFFGMELTPMVVGRDEFFKEKVQPNVLACLSTLEAKEMMYHIKGTFRIAMPTCSAVEQVEEKGFELHSFIECDTVGKFWTELETTDFLDDTIRFNPVVGEVSKVFTTMAGLSRKVGEKEQRVLIAGDADLFSNNEFKVNRGISSMNNLVLLGATYWLSEGKAPIDVRRPLAVDNKVYLSSNECMYTRWGIRIIFPLLVLGVAVYIWLRRRGR